jgi:hypothetical protein
MKLTMAAVAAAAIVFAAPAHAHPAFTIFDAPGAVSTYPYAINGNKARNRPCRWATTAVTRTEAGSTQACARTASRTATRTG